MYMIFFVLQYLFPFSWTAEHDGKDADQEPGDLDLALKQLLVIFFK